MRPRTYGHLVEIDEMEIRSSFLAAPPVLTPSRLQILLNLCHYCYADSIPFQLSAYERGMGLRIRSRPVKKRRLPKSFDKLPYVSLSPRLQLMKRWSILESTSKTITKTDSSYTNAIIIHLPFLCSVFSPVSLSAFYSGALSVRLFDRSPAFRWHVLLACSDASSTPAWRPAAESSILTAARGFLECKAHAIFRPGRKIVVLRQYGYGFDVSQRGPMKTFVSVSSIWCVLP